MNPTMQIPLMCTITVEWRKERCKASKMPL